MRYATVKRQRIENFIAHDLHDEAINMDYYVWFLRSGEETILVDTGFSAEAARQRKRTYLRCPIESLQSSSMHRGGVSESLTDRPFEALFETA
ncbi:MAG: hypothetical protein A3E79_12840 [Burkholderiales bacterium RIFCSPHIGHO2_12_FULL_61_11]|nr:MAG: hypothetical protein A3E79_12840 [Burkholderiales bacterium RIFCSPHIGHO2_12_FULL_61_11]